MMDLYSTGLLMAISSDSIQNQSIAKIILTNAISLQSVFIAGNPQPNADPRRVDIGLKIRSVQPREGGGVLPIMAYMGRLRPKRDSFLRLQVYKRVGISQV